MACNHCKDAPCLNFCPANAYSRDELTGAVEIDQKRCIGCGYCTWNCPYDVPKLIEGNGVIEKCDWCNEKLHVGEKPACVSACVTGALSFSKLPEETINNENTYNTFPRLNIKDGKKETLKTFIDTPVSVPDQEIAPDKKITAKKEWPLVVFTILFPIIGAKYLFDIQYFKVNIWLHMISLALAALFSSLHLGKPLRAWRALLNIKKSWLSREILFFSLFGILSTISVLIPTKYLIVSTCVTLIAGLISIDKVYFKYLNHDRLHSASSIIIFLTVYTYCWSVSLLLPVMLVVGMVLYLKRKVIMQNNKSLNLTSYLRIILGYITPLILIYSGDYTPDIIAALVGYGIVIDRIEFYNEIEPNSPTQNLRAKEGEMLDNIGK
jgi:NAD-dependent dihydropyrimidine dehydrogenase PreA subunit